jgi:hypothetical protein
MKAEEWIARYNSAFAEATYREEFWNRRLGGWKLNPEWEVVSKRQELAKRLALEAGYPEGFTYDFDPGLRVDTEPNCP